ncbi:cardiac phospholamban isoform X2 [Tachysurus vachellii]|uniref:cardiac phospholamban isoform X2 n=1 Tax=Tachysurus vachellii TaxID=175792 RepID=UPI00296AE644|nr:cardiac phospholamban isoform X2 [Tachysurus vachellii]
MIPHITHSSPSCHLGKDIMNKTPRARCQPLKQCEDLSKPDVKAHRRRLDLTATASLPQAQDGQHGVTSSSSRHRTPHTSVPEPHGASLRARTPRSSSSDTPALTSAPWISPTTEVSTCCSTSCSL